MSQRVSEGSIQHPAVSNPQATAPGTSGKIGLRPLPEGMPLHATNCAEFTIGQPPLELLRCGAVEMLKIDGDKLSAFALQLDQPIQILNGCDGRLFQQDVEPGCDHLAGIFIVAVDTRGNHHGGAGFRRDIFQQLVRTVVDGEAPVPAGLRSGIVRVRCRRGQQIANLRHFGQTVDQVGGISTAADHCQIYALFVCIHHSISTKTACD